MTDSSPPPAEVSGDRSSKARRRVPPRGVGFTVVICLVLILVVRLTASLTDHAVANIACFCLALISLATIFCWFLLFSGFSRLTRTACLVAMLAGLASSVVLLRYDHVSGELVPKFRFRWQPPADVLLGEPQASRTSVDLTSSTPDDFPQFLGPDRDATIDTVALQDDWNCYPPKLRWRISIGAGWSGFAAVNGYAVTMEQRGQDELVTCYDIDDGTICWFHAVNARHITPLGGIGPRCTPTIDDGRVYALGATGILRCLNGADGSLIWTVNLLDRIGVTPEEDLLAIAWGRAASPLIVDDLVIVPQGGPADGQCTSLVAFDKRTGEVVWESGNRQVSYASPSLVTIAEQKQILIVNEDTVSGHDPVTGEVLWESDWPGNSAADANVSQAVHLGKGRILLSKGYGAGARLIQVERTSGGWRVSKLEENRRVLKTKFTNVVVLGSHAYALSDGILECVDLNTLERVWKGGRYGQGQILGVGDRLVVQAESGDVALVSATPDGYLPLGTFPALDGQTWNTLCLYGRLLLVRNAQQAACVELP